MKSEATAGVTIDSTQLAQSELVLANAFHLMTQYFFDVSLGRNGRIKLAEVVARHLSEVLENQALSRTTLLTVSNSITVWRERAISGVEA